MPVPQSFADLTPIASTNSPQGTESVKGTIDDYLRAAFALLCQQYNQTLGPSVTLASAATVNIGFAQAININITGTTNITAFDTWAEGTFRWTTFFGALTLKYNATSMQLPGGADITTAAGDVALFRSLGGGNWKCLDYVHSSGDAVIPALPRAGGTMSGAILFNNGQGLQAKDASGTPHAWMLMGTDNNVNHYNAGGGAWRLLNQAGGKVLLSIDDNGNSTQSGTALINANGAPTVNGATAYAASGSFGGGYKMIDGGTQQAQWLASGTMYWGFGTGGALSSVASLTSSGGFSANTITQTSDERKKRAWQRLPGDFIARLAGIRRSGLFTWKKGGTAGLGVGAQSLEAILPVAVHTDEHGAKTVNYGAAAMVSVVELARAFVALEARVRALEPK